MARFNTTNNTARERRRNRGASGALPEQLTPEQEIELAKRIEAGLFAGEKLETDTEIDEQLRSDLAILVKLGESATKSLVEANSRLVMSLAKRHSAPGRDFSDLVQEGHVGLAEAVRTFDYKDGKKFSDYAAESINQAIKQAIAKKVCDICVPENSQPAGDIEQRKELISALTTLPELQARIILLHFGLESEPPKTAEEISEQLGISLNEIETAIPTALATLKSILSD
jgi:RNA polymerase sigma factor (sigma-70 family)